MLRRNARKILKYLLISIVILTCGLLFFKSFTTIVDIDNNRIETREKYSGFPQAPKQKVL